MSLSTWNMINSNFYESLNFEFDVGTIFSFLWEDHKRVFSFLLHYWKDHKHVISLALDFDTLRLQRHKWACKRWRHIACKHILIGVICVIVGWFEDTIIWVVMTWYAFCGVGKVYIYMVWAFIFWKIYYLFYNIYI